MCSVHTQAVSGLSSTHVARIKGEKHASEAAKVTVLSNMDHVAALKVCMREHIL